MFFCQNAEAHLRISAEKDALTRDQIGEQYKVNSTRYAKKNECVKVAFNLLRLYISLFLNTNVNTGNCYKA